jgi:hypothetical protein
VVLLHHFLPLLPRLHRPLLDFSNHYFDSCMYIKVTARKPKLWWRAKICQRKVCIRYYNVRK